MSDIGRISDVDCGLPLEPIFRRHPWLALVFVIACYVVGAYLDGVPQ